MAKRVTVDTPDGEGWIELSREVKAEVNRLIFEEAYLAEDALLEVLRQNQDGRDGSEDAEE